MTRTPSRLLRSLLAALVAAASLVTLVGTAAPAGATTGAGAPTYEILAGSDAIVTGGVATVSREHGDVQDTISVDLYVPGGFDETHLCVSDAPFTGKVSPGQCEYGASFGNKGPETYRYEIEVDRDATVYLQLHVVIGIETAYAGWVGGSPHHGNIEVPNPPQPEPELECPEDMYPRDGVDLIDADEDGVAENCEFVPVEGDCPEGQEPIDGETPMDIDGDGEVDEGCEVPEEVQVVVADTCPDGTPMTDRNGDGVVDAGDCVTTSVLPTVVVPNLPVHTPALPPLTPTFPSTPVQPTTPVQPVVATPLAPVPTVDVLPAADVAPTVVTVDNPQVTEVLGDQVVAGTLPRTGAATPGLAAFGALLLAVGVVLTGMGRRTA